MGCANIKGVNAGVSAAQKEKQAEGGHGAQPHQALVWVQYQEAWRCQSCGHEQAASRRVSAGRYESKSGRKFHICRDCYEQSYSSTAAPPEDEGLEKQPVSLLTQGKGKTATLRNAGKGQQPEASLAAGLAPAAAQDRQQPDSRWPAVGKGQQGAAQWRAAPTEAWSSHPAGSSGGFRHCQGLESGSGRGSRHASAASTDRGRGQPAPRLRDLSNGSGGCSAGRRLPELLAPPAQQGDAGGAGGKLLELPCPESPDVCSAVVHGPNLTATRASERKYSLKSEKALDQLESTDSRLRGVEEKVRKIAHTVSTSPTLDRKMHGHMKTDLALLEAEAHKLESQGVDNIYTSELQSGKTAAKELKREQLRRLEGLFVEIDDVFKAMSRASELPGGAS
eukprot:TRINITY_DN81934_c0_g1_i1.p1 TRINITY_DN81934_c0_g1~~TRINITY_DN81934_c0_g1_i1.p1  ORF type:complete len:393 (+),score=93.01 TRINITY_DN81934_c0_g1_i1:60-1238(+)